LATVTYFISGSLRKTGELNVIKRIPVKHNGCVLFHRIDTTDLPFKIKKMKKGKVEYPYKSILVACIDCGMVLTIDEYGRLV